MTDIIALKNKNAARWAAMQVNPSRLAALDATAHRLCAPNAKKQYQAIERATNVPWFVVAVIHERETGQRWDRQLGQGDPLGQKSTHDPIGRGPFFGDDAFYRSALDALIDCPPYAAHWTDWSAGGTLTLLEEYNGLGYANKGVPSAYVWSGSNQYKSGKYVADHDYREDVIDVQQGCAPLISRMMAIDSSIKFGGVTNAASHGTAGAVVVAGTAVATQYPEHVGLILTGTILAAIIAWFVVREWKGT